MSRRHRRNRSSAPLVLLLVGAMYYENVEAIENIIPRVVVIIVAFMTLALSIKISRLIRSMTVRSKISDIDNMSGIEFEQYLVVLLRKLGYKHVRMTEKYDLGIDIIARKDGITWGIQTKRHSGLVKVAAVRQAYTALSHYKCDKAMVISNSHYSRPALVLAKETGTALINRELLTKWIYESSKQR